MNTVSAIKVKKPKGDGWVRLDFACGTLDRFGFPYARFIYNNIIVISAVEVADDEPEIGPEYHLSISESGRRVSSNVAKWVIKQFSMSEADEDNHVPNGIVRNFWMPVNENLIGHVCPCKESEPAIKEDKGDFIWRGITK